MSPSTCSLSLPERQNSFYNVRSSIVLAVAFAVAALQLAASPTAFVVQALVVPERMPSFTRHHHKHSTIFRTSQQQEQRPLFLSDEEEECLDTIDTSRRETLSSLIQVVGGIATATGLVVYPEAVNAEDENPSSSSTSTTKESADQVLSSTVISSSPVTTVPAELTVPSLLNALKQVPTFCIVDPKPPTDGSGGGGGAAYMLYQRDTNFAKGYAFVTYDGALVVLQDAIETAKKGGYLDTWKDATITTIPMNIAVTLALTPRKRTSQKGNTVNSAVEIVPGYENRDAAMKIDKQLFKDVSKTPLFYFKDLTMSDAGGTNSVPLFFDQDALVEEWTRRYGEKVIPPRVQVIDLLTMIQYAIRGRSAELPFAGKSVVFVPIRRSITMAKDIKSKGLAPYNPDRMII